MMQEFCTQTGVEKEVVNARWLSCQVRLLKYAPLEQRKAVKSIVRDMEAIGFDDEGMYMKHDREWVTHFHSQNHAV